MNIFFVFLLLVSTTLTAQELASLESASYFQDGVVFEHKPTNFKSRFRFRVQNRFTYETEDQDDLDAKTTDFAVRRMRLRYEGNTLDSRLLFRFQFSFTRGDMDYDRTNYPNILRDAVVGWKLTPNTTLWYGQTKLPGNRQRVISSGSQQFVDRSLLNATFNIDRDIGIQLHHKMGEEKPLWMKFAISNGEGRGTENKDHGLAYTGRIEWLPRGEFKDEGDYFEADLAREETAKISMGLVYSNNHNTTRSGGQLGRQYTQKGLSSDIETWLADFLLKYAGNSLSIEYAKRNTPKPFFKDGANDVTIYKGEAVNVQLGHLFENNVETALRYTHLWADEETLQGDNNRRQYTIALSKYINHHRIKLQSDLTYDKLDNHVKDLDSSSWIYRLQFEVGI